MYGEVRRGIVVEDRVAVEETSQSSHLGRHVHDDDLHLDVKLELEDVDAGLECLHPGGYEHVPAEAEVPECVD